MFLHIPYTLPGPESLSLERINILHIHEAFAVTLWQRWVRGFTYQLGFVRARMAVTSKDSKEILHMHMALAVTDWQSFGIGFTYPSDFAMARMMMPQL